MHAGCARLPGDLRAATSQSCYDVTRDRLKTRAPLKGSGPQIIGCSSVILMLKCPRVPALRRPPDRRRSCRGRSRSRVCACEAGDAEAAGPSALDRELSRRQDCQAREDRPVSSCRRAHRECVTGGDRQRAGAGLTVAAAARAGARQRQRQRARLPPASGQCPFHPGPRRRASRSSTRPLSVIRAQAQSPAGAGRLARP